jgi:2-amino-4-hydroxy-6-hydroxymethyldihydropteridine diphosphokinase
MMDDSKQIILALGTNSEQELNMEKAREMLVALLGTLRFSINIWTHPIDIVSDDFLNCMVIGQTSMSLSALNAALKKIERSCGDTSYKRRKNVVKMDIDILKYDTTIMHERDWERPYILQLLDEMKIEHKNEI